VVVAKRSRVRVQVCEARVKLKRRSKREHQLVKHLESGPCREKRQEYGIKYVVLSFGVFRRIKVAARGFPLRSLHSGPTERPTGRTVSYQR